MLYRGYWQPLRRALSIRALMLMISRGPKPKLRGKRLLSIEATAMTDPKEVADLRERKIAVLERLAHAPNNLGAVSAITDWIWAADTALQSLSSELERVKGERDAALAQMKEESHEAFLCRKKVGQQKEIMLEAAAALNETLARAERAEASLGVAVKALRPAGNIAYNMKQTAIYTSDRENYRRISEAIDAALTSIQAKGE